MRCSVLYLVLAAPASGLALSGTNAAAVQAARLRSPAGRNRDLTCYGAANITSRGLEIFGSGGSQGEYMVHIGTVQPHHLTVEDCIVHDGYNNDLVKVNDFAHHITFRR